MPEVTATGERLDQWKGIADYLGRDVSTVIRWAKENGLPVHRVPGRQQRRPVFAFRHEIDDWMVSTGLAEETRKGNGRRLRRLAADANIEDQDNAMSSAAIRTPSSNKKTLTIWGWRTVATGSAGTLALCAGLALAILYGESAFHPPEIIALQQLTDNGLEKMGLRTDGKQLYFGQYQNGLLALAAMPIDGGPVRILWNPPMSVLPVDISPDARFLLALDGTYSDQERDIWVVPLKDGVPRRLGALKAHAAAYSPDGKTIAFANGVNVYLATADGSQARQIGRFTGVPRSLRWSMDGTRLYFTLLDPVLGKPSQWELAFGEGMSTTTLRFIPTPVELNADNFWSAARDGDNYFLTDRGIWLVQFGRKWWQRGIQVTELNSSMQGNAGIAFDPASKRLFVINDAGPDRVGIEEFDLHTQEFRYILPGVSGAFPEYSRNKQWIAWVDYQGTDRSLWISSASGNGKKQLAVFHEDIELPRWSPDGSQIAFMGKEPGRPYRIYVVPSKGGQPREASASEDNQGAPTWSPDGRYLAYANVLCLETDSCAVHTINLSTGAIQKVLGSDGLKTARWSPDGKYIAALQPELHQLWLFEMRSQHWRELADSIDSQDLAWSADSAWLYIAVPGAHARIARFSRESGDQQIVFDLSRLNTYEMTTAHDDVFTVAPDGDLIFSHPNSRTEIYSWRVQK